MRKLKDIDRIIEIDPARALQSLDSIPRQELSGDALAYYALLYTQAQVKCNVIVTSDSLMRYAYDKYSLDSSGNLKMRTHFYNADIAYNRGDLRGAMKDVLIAYELARNDNDSYWIAKTAEVISDIYYDAFNYSESLKYEQEAIDNYRRAGRIANHRYALCDLASIYLNMGKDKEALHLLDSLITVIYAEQPLDSALMEYAERTNLSALEKNNEFEKIESNLSKYLSPGSIQDVIDLAFIKGLKLCYEYKPDSASVVLSKAYNLAENEEQQIKIMCGLYLNAKINKDFKNAAWMADSLLILQNNVVNRIIKESIACVQRDFYSSEALSHKRKSENILHLLVCVIIIAVIITVSLIVIYRLKLQAKKSELEANISLLLHFRKQIEMTIAENENLSYQLENKNSTLELLKKQLEDKKDIQFQNAIVIEHLFKGKWSGLNMLCNEYFEMGESEKTRGAILNNIDKELKKLRSEKNLKEIENGVNLYMGGIMTLLRKECSFLKEDDFTFISLVFAGLSVRAVCLFRGIKYKLFYLKKSRLSKRIANSDSPHKELFLSKLQ